MEVTFKPSLEELGSRLMARKKEARKGGETVWEAYMRKKKERNAAKRVRPHKLPHFAPCLLLLPPINRSLLPSVPNGLALA